MPTNASSPVLVGRQAELAALNDAHAAATTGTPRFVFIGGEAGIGKSRLVREFIAGVWRGGATVLEGASPAVSGPELAYAPIVGALREFWGGTHDHPELAALIPPEAELSRLLPQLGNRPRESVATAGSQLRLYEEFLALLQNLAARDHVPVTLALEDLHWADASTRGLLAYLVRNLRAGRVLVLATYRSTDVNPSNPLQDLLIELERSEAVQLLHLEALGETDIEAETLAILGAGASMDLVRRITRRSGGNPLFVEQLAAEEQRGSSDPPRSLVALLLADVRRLPDQAQRLLRVAAVSGAASPARVLEAAAAAVGVDVGSALRAVRESGVLVSGRAGSTDVYAYRHPVLQEVLYAELPATERAQLHAVLAEHLEVEYRNGEASDPFLALEIARHCWVAGDLGRAYPVLVRAGHAAQEMHAFTEAHQLFERALLVAQRGGAEGGLPRRQIGFRQGSSDTAHDQRQLVQLTAQAASLAGQPQRAVELLEARPPGSTPNDATLLAKLGQYLWEAGRLDEALTAYQSAVVLATGAEHSVRVPVLRTAARTLMMAGRAHDALPLARQAADAAQDAGLESEASQCLATLAACLALGGAVDEAVAVLDQRRQLDERRRTVSGIRPRPSRIVDILSGYWSQAAVLERAGHLEESAAVALQGVERAKQLGARLAWGGLMGAAAIRELTELGRWSEADSLLAQLSTEQADPAAAEVHAAAARLLVLRGDFARATAHLGTAGVEQADVRPQVAAAVALAAGELAVWTGQFSEAARTVGAAIATLSPDSDRMLLAEMTALRLRIAADAASAASARRLSSERAEIERQASDLHGQLIALGGPEGQAQGGRKLTAWIETGRAEFERLGRESGAKGWAFVVQSWDALRQPYHAAYARWRHAEGLLSAKWDRREGRDALQAAHAACLELGAEPLRREVEGLARRARIGLSPSAGDEPPPQGVGPAAARPTLGLSTRELEVLMLLSEGWTNRRIAEALFITEKTAGHHVSSILSKLGVRSRVEAASVAIRAGVAQPPLIATAPTGMVEFVDAAQAVRLPRTLMFTDIVKSTALVEAIGDEAWGSLIAWHDGTLRSLFKSYSGTEVDHAGDGFFTVFADAVASVDCAIAIQRRLWIHRREHGFAPRIRIGIHSAEVSVANEGYKGRGVHEAARIASAAGPDEVLISADSLPRAKHYTTHEPRILTLAGVSAPVSVVPVDWRAQGSSP